MANMCGFEFRVKGSEANAKEFIRAMKWEGEYAEQGVGRVFGCTILEEGVDWNDKDYSYCLSAYGECAWSILNSMRDVDNPNNIEKLSERLNLTIEMFSEESGCGFMEHFAVKNGTVICDDCFDYYECEFEEFEEMMNSGEIDDDFWEEDYIKEAGMTKENYKEFVQDDYITVGGCAWDYEYV